MSKYNITLPDGSVATVEYSLPALIGSDKQVAFAADLLVFHDTIQKIIELRARAEYIKASPDAEKWARRGWGVDKCDAEIDGANAALAQSSASFWIGNFDAITAIRKPAAPQ